MLDIELASNDMVDKSCYSMDEPLMMDSFYVKEVA
jgi:hypothetical protein